MKENSLRAEDYVLIEKYSPVVYRMAYSMVKNTQDAEDIHQEVFVIYLAKRPEFAGEEHAKAWFLRVTINLAKNLWKTAWRQRVVSLGEADRHLALRLVDAAGNEHFVDYSVDWQEELAGEKVSFNEQWFIISEEELDGMQLEAIYFVTDGCVEGDWEVVFEIP